VTKADIVERVQQQIGTTRKEAAELTETVFGIMKNALEAVKNMKLSVLTFKPSTKLKVAINNG